MEDWKERLRDLYLVNNDDISSPNSIEFNWGGFLFKRKTAEPMHFYLATQESIEDFIEQEIEKAREEGFKNGMENAWGMINDILDTLDVDKNEEEINILIGILKVLDTEIIKLSKLTTK